jgi:hypothetical protein
MEQHTGKKDKEITTIKLSKETKARLENIRVYKRESFEDILKRILETFNLCRASPDRAKARLIGFERDKKKNLA